MVRIIAIDWYVFFILSYIESDQFTSLQFESFFFVNIWNLFLLTGFYRNFYTMFATRRVASKFVQIKPVASFNKAQTRSFFATPKARGGNVLNLIRSLYKKEKIHLDF